MQIIDGIKTYSPAEERMNIITHLLGVIATPFALALMLSCAKGAGLKFCCTLYAFSLGSMYLCSTLYHASKDPKARTLLRRADHAAIYFLIAGTYTPLMPVVSGTAAAVTILSVVWGIAVVGITFELAAFKPFKGFPVLMYLIAGWTCVSVFGDLIRGMTPLSLSLLAAGGIFYSLGVPFYVSKWNYAHAVWHLFVLAGAILQFLAILFLLMKI